jgi:hypothetical protein
MSEIENYIVKLETYYSKRDFVNQSVSNATVGWQIAHCFLVISTISRAVANSNPSEFQTNFNIKRKFVFLFKKLPRGKAKAPAGVQPKVEVGIEYLKEKAGFARENFLKLDQLDQNCYFAHPFFGSMNLKAAKKFIKIHTLHHIKIIEDILKQ